MGTEAGGVLSRSALLPSIAPATRRVYTLTDARGIYDDEMIDAAGWAIGAFAGGARFGPRASASTTRCCVV